VCIACFQEVMRRGLLASGSVWTNEALSRGTGTYFEREAAERRVDAMSGVCVGESGKVG
jgi:hypothetical protein